MKNIFSAIIFAIVFQSNAFADPPPAVNGLPAVQVTYIGINGNTTNNLSIFPPIICNVQNLDTLEITNHTFSSLPSCISALGRTLNILKLTTNKLVFLPDEIGDLLFLSNLDVRNNALTSIPNRIGDLKKLSNLNLSGNKLTSLPSAIGDAGALETLDLSNNQITDLPNSLAKLTRLRNLFLSKNQLKAAPAILPFLINLEKLDLSGNQIPQAEQDVITAIFKGRSVTITF